MSAFEIQALPAHWELQSLEDPVEAQLSQEDLQLVEEVWTQETANRKLYNGTVYCIHSFEEGILRIQPMSYKTVMAIERHPDFGQRLQRWPLGVTGVTECDGKILMGKRSKNVAIRREYWETAPAGSLDDANPEKQILEELLEETAIGQEHLTSLQAFAIAYDIEVGIKDLCYHIQLNPRALKVYAPNGEYSQLKWVEKADLPQFVAVHTVIPAATGMLDFLDLL